MTEAARPLPRLIGLVCPACASDLDGLPADRVFGCSACARAHSLDPEGLQPAPLAAWQPEDASSAVYLPVWSFQVEATVVLPPRARSSRAPSEARGDRLVPFSDGPVYVTAFDLRGRARFGDPGLHLTRRQPVPRLWTTVPLPALAGARLTLRAAEKLVAPTILAVVDARDDVLGAKVDLRISAATLVLVPFLRRADGAVAEPFGGVAYPPAAIPDLALLGR